jgi:lambda repressor-like predicted transcriptional regulator
MSNWALREIKAELTRKGLTFAEIDRQADLHTGTSRKAAAGTKMPNAELAIATALNRHPWEIFPENWRTDGTRIDKRFRDHTYPEADIHDS